MIQVASSLHPATFFAKEPFVESAITSIQAKIKTLYAFSYILGYAYFEKARLGIGVESMRDFKKAIEYYREALKKYPGDWFAYCNYSAALNKLAFISLDRVRNLLLSLSRNCGC